MNGTHNLQNMWSDGFTLADVPGAVVTDNDISDNTDVDLIFGGCANCLIQRNRITHSNSFASSSYAALMIQAWPNGATSGNYTGADISANSINCSYGQRCGFGLYVGASAWYAANIYGGNVHDNAVYGAQQGFAVDQVQNFSIANNNVDGSGGSFLASCGTRNFSAFDVTPGTNINRAGDGIASFNYVSFSLSGCVPNWYTQDPGVKLSPTPTPVDPFVTQQNALQIYQLAVQVLGRDANSLTPDQAFGWWGSILTNGGTLQDVRVLFATSPEVSNRIYDLAVQVLGRDPNSLTPAQALQFWGGNLQGTWTLQDIRNMFAQSPEAANRVYQFAIQILGRDPNSLTPAQAMADWGGNLANGGTIQDIQNCFATSPEAANQVYQLAVHVLGRDPNSLTPEQALATWGGNLAHGGSLQDIRVMFATSLEVSIRIHDLAVQVLGRDPNSFTPAQALQWWGGGLVSSGTLDDIRNIFENSPEGQAHRANLQ